MRRLLIATFITGVLLAPSTEVPAQGPPRRRRRTADALLKSYVEQLMKSQKDDGHWSHSYELGMTALCALALKHSNDPRAATAVARGVDYIVQHETEYKTYSAGTIISALYQVNPRGHRRVIDKYAGLLSRSQLGGGELGMFSYNLVGHGQQVSGRGDNSNTQFAVLGLLYAERAGYQVPRRVWENLKRHYTDTQNADGGWGYRIGRGSSHNMTLAGAVSLYIAEEQLSLGSASKCVMSRPSRPTEAAMKRVGDKFTTELDAYGLYALERLGILTGRSEFGGHYWYEEGARKIVHEGVQIRWGEPGTAFLTLFLSRGKEPIVINKLKYYGDWDCAHYDVKHITDYISDRMQSPMQWRVVTLEAKLDDLLKVPILHYHGIKGPAFNDEEKIKIRNYVLRGGVLMVQCCKCHKGGKEFDESFRWLMDECFPEGELEPLPATHPMFQSPRKLKNPPKVQVIKFGDRIGVIYLPEELAIDWHRGGARARPAFDAGVDIIFHVLKQAGRLGAGAKPIRD